jgi:hypothetical protein
MPEREDIEIVVVIANSFRNIEVKAASFEF